MLFKEIAKDVLMGNHFGEIYQICTRKQMNKLTYKLFKIYVKARDEWHIQLNKPLDKKN